MTHDRPYRSRLSDEQAIAELLRHRGTQFDPELTDLFLANLERMFAVAVEPVDAYTRGLRHVDEGDAA